MASCVFLADELTRYRPEPNRLKAHPMPPRPIRAAREAGFEHFSQISASMSSRSMKSGSRWKGTVNEGLGLIGDLSVNVDAIFSIDNIPIF